VKNIVIVIFLMCTVTLTVLSNVGWWGTET